MGDPCPICLDDLDNGEGVARLWCGHRFHAPCAEAWRRSQQKNARAAQCALCRRGACRRAVYDPSAARFRVYGADGREVVARV